jgi:hypothetical protein
MSSFLVFLPIVDKIFFLPLHMHTIYRILNKIQSDAKLLSGF